MVMLTSPGPTIGVVGGGQLGRMLGEAAAPLGVEVVVADPTPDPPAAPVTREQLTGAFDDPAVIEELAARADVLTYEIELADPDLLERIEANVGVPVCPSPTTLRTIQDKLVQKRRLQDAGIPVAPFRAVDSPADLRRAAEAFGTPLMVKARRGGYDGRGNVLLRDRANADAVLAELDGQAMAEAFVPFERELAVIGISGAEGTRTFPVTETIHREEILRETVTPARAPDPVRNRARTVAREVLELMDGRGVFGIELFEVPVPDGTDDGYRVVDTSIDEPDGPILLNEIAPRPHNSGHWTIEGAVTSQFEQHVRAVLGWPLGSTNCRGPTAIANLLGDVDEPRSAELREIERTLAEPGVHLHWYGKREARPLRKMGHLTATATDREVDPDALLAEVKSARDALTFET